MVLNIGLKKAIGMPFTYKQRLQEFLSETSGSPAIQANLAAEEIALMAKYTQDFKLCTPSLGYSAKLLAYQVLEIAVNGLLSVGSGVSIPVRTQLNRVSLSVLKYVGIEGEGDYHFQVEMFKAAELISTITGEIVENDPIPTLVGDVVKLLVFSGGSGYEDTVDGDTGTAISASFESSENDASTPGLVSIDLAGGVVVEKQYTVSSGEGFYVGQIVMIVDDGGSSLSYDTVALAEVIEIV